MRSKNATIQRDNDTHLSEQSQVAANPGPVAPVRAWGVRVAGRNHRLRSDFRGELDGRDLLEQAHEHERYLVVRELSALISGYPMTLGRHTYLLSQADAGAPVERKEDERIVGEVLLEAFIEETVGVKVQR